MYLVQMSGKFLQSFCENGVISAQILIDTLALSCTSNHYIVLINPTHKTLERLSVAIVHANKPDFQSFWADLTDPEWLSKALAENKATKIQIFVRWYIVNSQTCKKIQHHYFQKRNYSTNVCRVIAANLSVTNSRTTAVKCSDVVLQLVRIFFEQGKQASSLQYMSTHK